MKLLTPEIIATLPALYSQEEVPDPIVVVKFFTPDSSWTWYATEGQPEESEDGKTDFLFFGLVDGMEKELGYFCLSELERARGPLGLPIERDLHFKPQPLSTFR